MLKVGDKAPDFALPDQDGNTVSLATGIEEQVWQVVYFYPADDTPGCTAEACSFRDAHEDFTDAGATVIGVSSDDEASHRAFATKHRLPFRLVSDTDGSLAAAFGVRKTLGLLPARVTFVIDPTGIVRKVFSSQLRFNRHHTEALATIRAGTSA
jgi:thioredoxin-dependent peroxiredoxin